MSNTIEGKVVVITGASSGLEVAPGYADYQKRTSRDIPIVILHSIVQP